MMQYPSPERPSTKEEEANPIDQYNDEERKEPEEVTTVQLLIKLAPPLKDFEDKPNSQQEPTSPS